MRLDIKTSGFELTNGLRDHAQKRIELALDWAKENINKVAISLSDINGHRGGRDKCCQVHIQISGRRDVIIHDIESDMYVAIDLAVEQASQTLKRRLCRQRDVAINHERSQKMPFKYIELQAA